MNGKDLKGKVAIVTGGDSGLGFGIAEALAKLGVHVVIGAHNMTKGMVAAKNMTAATGTPVDALGLDLMSKASVHSFAEKFLKKYNNRLDLLINNAGIAFPSIKTEDGFESVFEVDYLGHFLLTELLLPALRSSHPSRIVIVSSSGHENACAGACWPQDCFKDWTYIPPPVVPNCTAPVFEPGPTYGAAKFLNIMHAKALAQREVSNGVQAFSINPAFVLTSATRPGFNPDSPGTKLSCMAQAHPPSLPLQQCPFNPAQGAAVIAYVATSSDVVPGAYYDRKIACEEGQVVRHGFSDAMIPELYTRSLAWAGLKKYDVVV
jgi:NAD(P)-dependent dehydrogenase (short-subunit alcohol dehydrogenase family)